MIGGVKRSFSLEIYNPSLGTILTATFLALSIIFLYFVKNIYLFTILSSLAIYTTLLTVLSFKYRNSDMVDVMASLIERAKVIESPDLWLSQAKWYTLLGFPLVAIVSIFIYVFTGNPYYGLASAALSPLTIFYPWVKTYEIRNNISSQMSKELPILALMMWSMSQLGIGVIKMIEQLKREKDTLPESSREFEKIYRDFVVFSMQPDDAVMREAIDHPSTIFERILSGSVSISKIGGSLSSYLDRMTVEVMDFLRDKWERFGKVASSMSELSLLFLLMLPMLAIWFAIVQNNPIYGADSIAFFMYPLLGIGLILYLVFQSPPEDVKIKGNLFWGLFLGGGTFAGIFLLENFLRFSVQLWMLFLFPVMVFTAVYGYPIYRRMKWKNEADEKMPIFLRSVAEHIRSTGDNLYTALTKLRGNKAFGREINRMIDSYLSEAVTVGQVYPDSDSWLAKTVFRSLIDMDRQGVLRYDVLRRLSEIGDAYYDALQKKKESLYAFLGSTVLAPALLAGIIVLTVYVMVTISSLVQVPDLQSTIQTASAQGFSVSLGGLTGILTFFQAFTHIGNVLEQMLPTLEFMIAETGVIFGILYAKAYDSTAKSTFRVFQVSIVALASILAMELSLFYILHINPFQLGNLLTLLS
ncbi:hypothetical protein HS7_16300 [Sulfolobales archaeon HS-7]|nr:hypothetical protein HS7_16300 [Sulfolobales archaeon HS-7]